MLECRAISGLEKILTGTVELKAKKLVSDVVARGETYSFQVALRSSDRSYVRIALQSPLHCQVRQVLHVPVHYPGSGADKDVINDNQPGLYPDLLGELDSTAQIWVNANIWYCLWVSVPVSINEKPGRYPVTLSLQENDTLMLPRGGEVPTVGVALDVQDFTLPEQQMIRFEWFHADCLASYYQLEAWSEKHWEIVENFAANAFHHGINMLYTPLWTPPLDTAVGHQRPTCQLLETELDLATMKYTFNFDRLRRYIAMGRKIGFRRFSMSHFFTQWGAEFTPKIVVSLRHVDNSAASDRYGAGSEFIKLNASGSAAIFGWQVRSTSPEYSDFLQQLMPVLLAVLRSEGLDAGTCFFSLSDEPNLDHISTYSKVVSLIRPLLEEFETLEALSSYEFFKRGLVQNPVPSIGHLEEFRGKTSSRWAYYCCGPEGQATNRFIGMPSRRTRMLGVLAWLYDLEGFLHWGFNFYHSHLSLRPVNPFACTDAGGIFPGGDPFLVYPGRDGKPLDSIRHEMIFAGLQDLRALRLLEAKIGRSAVAALLQNGHKKPFHMLNFPNQDSWLPRKRREIYRALGEVPQA